MTLQGEFLVFVILCLVAGKLVGLPPFRKRRKFDAWWVWYNRSDSARITLGSSRAKVMQDLDDTFGIVRQALDGFNVDHLPEGTRSEEWRVLQLLVAVRLHCKMAGIDFERAVEVSGISVQEVLRAMGSDRPR